MSDAGSERGGRRQFEQAQGDGKIRDFSNWERKGPLSPSTTAPPSLRDGGRQNSRGVTGDPALRRNSPAWGEGTGRSQDGSRPPRRDFSERQVVERAPTAAELDNKWRTNMRPDPPAKSPTPETSAPGSPAPSAAATAPTTRPKLNLTKRTVSEADPASPPPSTDPKASPFGAARPVDTLAREKEIEEKRELAIRQKKEADDKAREEKADQKRLAKEKADAEKAKAAETEGETEKPVSEDPSEAKENGTESSEKSAAAPKFEVLRRATSTDNDMVPAEDEEESDPTAIVTDKAVKPKEVIRDARPPKTNGAWRNNNGNRRDAPAPKAAAPAPESTTNSMEEDGWSTVTSTKKTNTKTTNRRGGGGGRGDRSGGDNAPARAIAS
jgi:translation initiation factor 4B